MNSKYACKLCLNVPKKNAMEKINSLPKTFTILLEEMSGVKFSKAESLDMIICTKCLNFLKNMDNSSVNPKSNKITEAGKKRVFKLMEKKRVPAAQAIEIVLAEQRARELLVESGLKVPDAEGNLQSIVPPAAKLSKPRLSGAQRKKVSILIDAGMDPGAARQLIYAAIIAKQASGQNNLNHMTKMQGPNEQGGSVGQRRPRQQNANVPLSKRAPGQKNNLPQGGVAQTGKAKSNQNTPVQRVAPVKVVPQKAGPNAKGPNQRGPVNKKATDSPGILIPQNKRQNNNSGGGRGPNSVGGRVPNSVGGSGPNSVGGRGHNSGGGRGPNSDKRVGPIVTPRRNDRPAPYNTSRQQNQSQSQNNNNNQQQQQQRKQQNISLEVGIVPINYPNVMLDELKLDALKEAITNEILKIPQGGPLIRFLGTSSQNGWLKIICADELSHNWLAMLVSRWERAGVRMVEGNALPQPAILSFYLQGDFRSPDEIFSIIEKQNNALHANQWRVINRESDGNGQMITVCVDEQCFQALRSRDFMVFLGLGVVELKPRRSLSDDIPFSNNLSSQNFGGNDNGNFLNSGGNNMQGGIGGMGYNNYQLMNSGRGNGNNGGGNNYQNQGQGYQRGGYQSQRAW